MANFSAFATGLFGRVVDKYEKTFEFVRDSLPRAGIKIPFRTYLSLSFLSTSLIYIFSLIITLLILSFLKINFLLKTIITIYIPLFLALLTFAIFILLPYQKVNSRKKNIDLNLPFALSHMAAIAESGVPPYMIFRLLSGFDEYGEIAREMKILVRNVETFGIDPLTAVRELAERTPSIELRQIMLGFVSTTESGGDVKTYIKNAGEQALFNWRLKREKFMQQLSAYAEFYTGILIAAPLFIISLFAVMSLIQPNIGGLDILTLAKLSIYGLIPMLNVGFLIFLRGVEVEI